MTINSRNDGFMDDLLVKYLLKEAGESENAAVEQWLNASPENQIYYNQLQKVWNESEKLFATDSSIPDAAEAWERFRQRIHSTHQPQKNVIKLNRRRWLIAAASIVIILSSGLWSWNYYSSGLSKLTVASTDNVITDTLPDNTIVTLNKNSSISYPKKFKNTERSVALKGEAFFSVKHQDDHPFVVHVNNIVIKDIGTAFNVKAKGNITEIIVASGSVKITDRDQSVILNANEKVTVSNKDGIFKKEKLTNNLYNYYRTKEFVCNNTPLEEVVKTLNDAYGAQIVVASSQLNELFLTTTFHRNQPLDSILTIITQTFPQVAITRQGEEIILHKQ